MKNSGVKIAVGVVLALGLLNVISSLKTEKTNSGTYRSGQSYSYSGGNGYSSGGSNTSQTPPRPAVNTTPAMTKEEAERLRGTGYHGCRPNSSAENTALAAAQVKCKNCGYHSDNGSNSLCDYCAWMERYGGGLPSKATDTPAPTRAVSPSKETSKTSDPFDAASYSHPDDFYYDHYDDFWDYEDAEDYWEEHHK